jgi:hypothetical protein
MSRGRKDYTIDVDEGRQKYADASNRAMGRIAKLGIDVLDDRPESAPGKYFDGRLPANVNDLSAGELGELYALMLQHTNWLTGYVTIAKAETQNTAEQLKLVKSRIRKTKTGTKDEREDDTICDSRYVEANARWLEAVEYHAVLSGLHEAASRDLRVISRLVTLKEVEFEQGRRTGNIKKRGGRNRFSRDRDDA